VTTVSTIVTADSKKNGGIGHVRLEWPVTIRWNERSRSFGIGGHVGVEYAGMANDHGELPFGGFLQPNRPNIPLQAGKPHYAEV